MPKRYLGALLALLLSACASMNNALHPSTQVVKDDFDGSLVVRQQPVSAANGVREPWHTLGFEWSQKHPDTVYLTVGANGAGNISEVAFNADGRIYDNLKVVNSASGRFAMPWSSFLALAEAGSVKMKVARLDEATVSSFGPKHPGAAVNPRLSSFVTTVREVRSGNKNPLARLDKKKKDAKPAKK
jgi:hypothetical protein